MQSNHCYVLHMAASVLSLSFLLPPKKTILQKLLGAI